MIQSGSIKLFGSIVASTIWREDDKTRLVWITLLALSDRDGFVAFFPELKICNEKFISY